MRGPWDSASESPGRPGPGPAGRVRVRRSSPGRPARGFTLVEAIVVVALVGFLAMIGLGELNKFSRREKLATNSSQLAVLLQEASLSVRQRDAVAFVKIGPAHQAATEHGLVDVRDVDLVADTCCGAGGVGNGQFDDPTKGATGDTVVKSLRIPLDQISFSTTSAASPYPVEQGNWTAGSVADTLVVGVNFRGQTVGPNGATLAGPATLAMTHVDMVSGSLLPMINYQIRINPVWDVSVRRLVKDQATGQFNTY